MRRVETPELCDKVDPATDVVEPESDSFPLDDFLHLVTFFSVLKFVPTGRATSEKLSVCRKK